MKKNSSRIMMINITKNPFPPPHPPKPLAIIITPLCVILRTVFKLVSLAPFKYRPPFYFQYMGFSRKVLLRHNNFNCRLVLVASVFVSALPQRSAATARKWSKPRKYCADCQSTKSWYLSFDPFLRCRK